MTKSSGLSREEKAAQKKQRAKERREARKLARASGEVSPSRKKRPRASPSPRTPYIKDEHEWLRRASSLAFAQRVINSHPERPYWLSIPHAYGEGDPPVANCYPCTAFRTKARAYYGFLFREHRDLLIERWDNARKELTDTVSGIAPRLIPN